MPEFYIYCGWSQHGAMLCSHAGAAFDKELSKMVDRYGPPDRLELRQDGKTIKKYEPIN